MTSGGLKFIRVQGRIVPLHAPKNGKKFAQGVGLTTAGAGTAVVAGHAAAKSVQQAARFHHEAKWWAQKASNVGSGIYQKRKRDAMTKAGQMAFDFSFKIKQPRYHRFTKTALKTSIKSKGFKVLHKGLKAGGLVAATALMGVGLTKAYEGYTGKKAGAEKGAIAGAAGTASVFALNSSYAHKIMGGGSANLLAAIKYGLRKARVK
jgi:hypothetical protein